MAEKNRDFSQVRVGTVVGFDKAPWAATPTTTITQKMLDGWDWIDAKPHFSARLFSRNLWERYGGYIISQPEDAQEPAEDRTLATFSGTFSKKELKAALAQRTDTQRLDWLADRGVRFENLGPDEGDPRDLVDQGGNWILSGTDIRKMIDAAMDQEAGR